MARAEYCISASQYYKAWGILGGSNDMVKNPIFWGLVSTKSVLICEFYTLQDISVESEAYMHRITCTVMSPVANVQFVTKSDAH